MTIDPKNVLQLNLPQWQGGDRPDYRLGAQGLAAIAPEPKGPMETIPVPRFAGDVRPIDRGIVSREASLHASNVQLVCPECGAQTRIGHRILGDGRKVRFCRKCEGVVDK